MFADGFGSKARFFWTDPAQKRIFLDRSGSNAYFSGRAAELPHSRAAELPNGRAAELPNLRAAELPCRRIWDEFGTFLE